MKKSRIICSAKNVENPATFAEGFWPEFQGRGRFMKYSMSVPIPLLLLSNLLVTSPKRELHNFSTELRALYVDLFIAKLSVAGWF